MEKIVITGNLLMGRKQLEQQLKDCLKAHNYQTIFPNADTIEDSDPSGKSAPASEQGNDQTVKPAQSSEQSWAPNVDSARSSDPYNTNEVVQSLQRQRSLEENICRTYGCEERDPSAQTLVVYLDGLMDAVAGLSTEKQEQALASAGLSRLDARDRYDAVFCLRGNISRGETPAAGRSSAKETASVNSSGPSEQVVLEASPTPAAAREPAADSEFSSPAFSGMAAACPDSAEEYSSREKALLSAWAGTPHLRVIAGTSAAERFSLLREELFSYLGIPEPMEIERKFLIKRPDPALLENHPLCGKAEIVQTYTKDAAGKPIRLRARGVGSDCMYFETRKIPVSDIARIEVERRLDREEYEDLLAAPAVGKRQLCKTRYCLIDRDQYFEIDLYPFWKEQAFLEIELRSEDQTYRLPDFIQPILEVSADPAFRNFALAEKYNTLR